MSNISDGIEYALKQARAERAQKTAADSAPVPGDAAPTGSFGAQIKEAAQVFLADDEEDVTVGDLRSLMAEFQ